MKKLLLLLCLSISFIGFSQNELVMQNGIFNTCDAIFTDSGGLNGDYSGSEDFTLTLYPENDNESVSVAFFEFNIQADTELFIIYDGETTSADTIGTYSGTDIQQDIFTATNPLGCLTFSFFSSSGSVGSGWAAEVSCVSDFFINQPTDYVICDEFGGGFGNFDLHLKDQEILGGQSPNDFIITYHNSLLDADNGTNALSSPYFNTTNPETICARVENIFTGNYETTCFNLVVNELPIPNINDVYEICDASSFLVDTGLTDQNIFYSWYLDGFILPNEFSPFLLVTQAGFYTLEISTADGCFAFYDFQVALTSFDSIIDPLTHVVCDEDDDGVAVVNLDSITPEILGGNQNPSLLVTYHTSQAEADGFFNVLDPIFTNTIPFAQTIFARVSSNTGDCFNTSILNLIIDTNCVSATSVEVIVCAEDPNIPVDYDLTSQEAEMVNGQNPSDFTFEYYLSESSANNQSNPIVDPDAYNVSGNSSVVYVRIEDNVTASFTVVQIFVNFSLNPQINFNGPYSICSGNEILLFPEITNDFGTFTYLWSTGETSPEIFATTAGTYTLTVTDQISGCESTASVDVIEGSDAPTLSGIDDLFSCEPNSFFDLTATLPEILNGQDESQFIISFFDNANSAFSNTNAIFDPTNFIALEATETIFVRVQNVNDACFSIIDFNIITENSCVIPLDCSQGPVNVTFCYESSQVTEYYYESTDSSTLQVFFNAGQVENNFDALVILDSDGVTNLNPEATTYGNSGDLTGLSFVSSGNSIRIAIDADTSISCANQNYIPIDFVVSCVDPNAVPGCNTTLSEPLDGATDVDVNTEIVWTAASGIVDGYKLSLGLTAGGTEVIDNLDVGNVLTYDVGTLDYSITYYVTITAYNTNGDAESCPERSFTTRANPNQTVICEDGALNTAYCFGNNDDAEFAFESSDGEPLTIVFNAGTTEVSFDEIYVIDSDGTILNADLPYGINGDFAGFTYTSSGDSLTVRFDTDGSISCENGSSCCTEPFDFDVFCASSVGFIQVNAFVDANTNMVFDTNEFSFSNGFFTYEVNGDGMVNTVNSSTGSFQIISGNETDVYDVTFNLYEEYEACYDINTVSFDNISVATGSTITLDFPVVEEQSCEDLAVHLISNWAPPRPGFDHNNYLYLENLGFTTIASGTVEYVVDPLLVINNTFNVNPNYTINTTATGFTVDFVNLQPGDVESIGISLFCPVTVDLGEIVTGNATYLTDSNDLVPSNNYSTLSEIVVGSWDPNDKMEARGPRVLFDEFSNSDEWLYYTIRFQNLGTADAIFVRIEDALDDQLDETTFQMIRSSHDYVVTRTESDLEWFFDDIFLPAEQDDPEGSIGYVYFRIKPKAGYALGDVIPNTAAIYFDFNAPVITNRFETEFIEESLSVSEFDNNGFEMYPNPANAMVNIKFTNRSSATISIIDISGKLVLEQKVNNQSQLELNISDLQSGLYFVKLEENNMIRIKKLVKE